MSGVRAVILDIDGTLILSNDAHASAFVEAGAELGYEVSHDEVLRRIGEMSDAYGLKVANIFHAGDGNLHPLVMFDANDPDSQHRAEAFGADILRLCVEVGGCLTGEHGVGVEKRDLMGEQFRPEELALQRRIKTAFDPAWLLNPAKVFPLEAA